MTTNISATPTASPVARPAATPRAAAIVPPPAPAASEPVGGGAPRAGDPTQAPAGLLDLDGLDVPEDTTLHAEGSTYGSGKPSTGTRPRPRSV